MPKPKIMYISPSLAVKGGISSLIRSYLKSDLADKYEIISVYSHVSGSKIVKIIKALSGLIHTATNLTVYNIDIVHFHGGGCISALRKYVYFLLVKLFDCKVIFHVHGGTFPQQYKNLSPLYQSLITRLLEQVDLVICLSTYFQKEILAIAPHATVTVLMNSVTVPPLIARNEETGEIRIIYLGLINEKKGIFDLLRVMSQLLEDQENIRLIIGGVGDVERMHQEMERLGISRHIEYLGWLQTNERDNLLGTADIVVLPSYGEGMPMTILEAMSFGIPVVSTRVGGVPDIVIDGETGFLIEPGNLQQLYDKLSRLVRDHALRSNLGAKGRSIIKERHSIGAATKRMEIIYNALITGATRSLECEQEC